MTQSLPFLAALFGEGSANPWYKLSAATREYVIVVGVFAAITLLLLALVALFHKPRRRREHSHARSATPPRDAAPQKRRKWRRRRREHRPRNPTLAETGGLPPLRTEGSSQTSL